MYDEYEESWTKDGQALYFATNLVRRMRGLFDRRISSGLLMIAPCHSIHTFGMGDPIDVAFFDCRGTVIKSCRVDPWHKCSCRGAEGVLERVCDPSSNLGWFEPGDRLHMALGRRSNTSDYVIED